MVSKSFTAIEEIMINKFVIDPVIEKNSYYLTDMGLSQVYLKNDKQNPWFILVPKKMRAIEIMDLTHEDQTILMEEITIVSEFIKNEYGPDKLNVGSLGNIVKQLHIHVIARYETDRAWPGPIWGSPTTSEFSSEELENLKNKFVDFIS